MFSLVEFDNNKHTEEDAAIMLAANYAVDTLGIDKLTDSVTCGGGIGDFYVTVRKGASKTDNSNLLFAYPLNIKHTRLALVDILGKDAYKVQVGNTVFSVYKEPTADDRESGKVTTIVDADGKPQVVKADKNNNAITVKMALRTFFAKYYKPQIQDILHTSLHRTTFSNRGLMYKVDIEKDIEFA